MAPDRERSKSPMGRSPLPATVMNVKMCCAKCEEKAKEECEEVEGVVKVVTKQSENKVIVYGAADPSALLKKMRRHLDKHAMYWPMDETNQDQVAPPLFPVDPRELHSQNRGGLERSAGGPPLQTGTVLHVDPRDGKPLLDSREVRQVERELKDAEIRERVGGPHQVPREVINHGPKGGPREVVFIPVDAKDGTPVDPRRVHQVDPRDGGLLDPSRMDAAGRPITLPHATPGHGPELREVRPIHDSRDPPVELREVRPIDLREPGRPVDASELRPIDPRNMMRHGDPREVQRMDPHVAMRTSEPLDHRDDLRSVDPRMVRQIDPRDGRLALDPRDRDLRDGRAAAAAYGPSDPPPRAGMRGVPEGLVPVRTGRDSREVHFAPSRGNNLSPTHGPRDMGARSPRDVEYMSRSPRQHAPDYGPRSPRDDYGPRSPRDEYGPRSPRDEYGPRDYSGADYGLRSPRFEGGTDYSGPRSPRFEAGTDYSGPRSPRGRAGDYDHVPQRTPAMRPALDRELSFSEFGPGRDPRGAAAMDQGHTAGRAVPLPYEPVDPRDAAPFDFHGGGAVNPRPRSPRSGGHLGPAGPDQPPLVRGYGYGDVDPRQFRPPASEPRVLLDVTHELPGSNAAGIRYNDTRDYINDPVNRDRDDVMNHRRGGLDGSPRQQHVSQYSEFRKGEADILRDYQPKESYFSDYHPSQHYQPGPLATQEIDEVPVINPNYKKHLSVGPDQF